MAARWKSIVGRTSASCASFLVKYSKYPQLHSCRCAKNEFMGIRNYSVSIFPNYNASFRRKHVLEYDCTVLTSMLTNVRLDPRRNEYFSKTKHLSLLLRRSYSSDISDLETGKRTT